MTIQAQGLTPSSSLTLALIPQGSLNFQPRYRLEVKVEAAGQFTSTLYGVLCGTYLAHLEGQRLGADSTFSQTSTIQVDQGDTARVLLSGFDAPNFYSFVVDTSVAMVAGAPSHAMLVADKLLGDHDGLLRDLRLAQDDAGTWVTEGVELGSGVHWITVQPFGICYKVLVSPGAPPDIVLLVPPLAPISLHVTSDDPGGLEPNISYSYRTIIGASGQEEPPVSLRVPLPPFPGQGGVVDVPAWGVVTVFADGASGARGSAVLRTESESHAYIELNAAIPPRTYEISYLVDGDPAPMRFEWWESSVFFTDSLGALVGSWVDDQPFRGAPDGRLGSATFNVPAAAAEWHINDTAINAIMSNPLVGQGSRSFQILRTDRYLSTRVGSVTPPSGEGF